MRPKKPKKKLTNSEIGKKSKRKGDKNEREIVKIFKSWWGTGEWARTPKSGGWGSTQQYRADFNASGDIVTTATDFPFVIEVKSEEGWDFEHLLRSPDTCLLTKWWGQTLSETIPGKSPMLVFTKNLRPWYVMLCSIAPTDLLVNQVKTFHATMTSSHLMTTMFMLDHLTEIPKEQVVEIMKRTIRKGMGLKSIGPAA